MKLLNVIFFITCIGHVHGYKYLFQIINSAYSHISFSGKLADALVDNGHQVDFLIRRYNTFVSGNGTKKANVIIHTPKNVQEINKLMSQLPMYHDVFQQSGDIFTLKGLNVIGSVMVKGCEGTLEAQDLIDKLRSQKYDAAFVEHIDTCGLVLAELVGIKKVMFTSVQGLGAPGRNHLNLPSPPGLIPVYNEVPPSGHQMSFIERATNLYHYLRYHFWIPRNLYTVVESIRPGLLPPDFPNTRELASKVIYLYVNSVDFLNFPDFYTPQVKHIGGIGLPKAGKIDDFLLPIIDKAKKGVVWFSFGSIVDTKKMNPDVRQGFISAFTQFPDYQFIWQMKNADDEDVKEAFQSYDNIHIVKWVNQPALLAHEKTKAMISHGGLTGLFEAINFGVPLVSIPMFMDHKRSAALAKYHGIGVILDKYTLSPEKIAGALREVLENPSYKKNVQKVKAVMKDAPQTPEQIFLDSVIYATKYGDELIKTNIPPMSWIQYFCIDVIILVVLATFIVLFIIVRFAQKCYKGVFIKKRRSKAKKS